MLSRLSLVVLIIIQCNRFEFGIVAPLEGGDTLSGEAHCSVGFFRLSSFFLVL
jgi:hypothetical protein